MYTEQRGVGYEQEAGVIVKVDAGSYYAPEYEQLSRIYNAGVPAMCEELGIAFSGMAANCWPENGSRLYIDHVHPEYATPMTGSLMEGEAARQAGERLLHGVFRHAVSRGKISGYSLYGNVADGMRRTTWGIHTNFELNRQGCGINLKELPVGDVAMTNLPPAGERVIRNLSYLGMLWAVSPIFGGGGDIWFGDDGQPNFVIGAKAASLERTFGEPTTHHKPLVNRRDQPEAIDSDGVMRLHQTCCDPSSPKGNMMSTGTTNLVLDCIEHQLLDDFPFGVDFESLYKIALGVTHDPTCRQTYEVDVRGRTIKVTANDIFYELITRAYRLEDHKDLSPDDLWTLENSVEASDIIAKDPLDLEWAAWPFKLRLLQHYFGEPASWGRLSKEHLMKLRALNLAFDKISPDNPATSFKEMARRGIPDQRVNIPDWSSDQPPEELIQKRMRKAPPGGRDELRGQLIAQGGCSSTGWSTVHNATGKHELPLRPPNKIHTALEVAMSRF
ncbi:MAG TPA: proteasome accessory factor PafA2 family protein [Candidatus Saccharimonadales bacterium]